MKFEDIKIGDLLLIPINPSGDEPSYFLVTWKNNNIGMAGGHVGFMKGIEHGVKSCSVCIGDDITIDPGLDFNIIHSPTSGSPQCMMWFSSSVPYRVTDNHLEDAKLIRHMTEEEMESLRVISKYEVFLDEHYRDTALSLDNISVEQILASQNLKYLHEKYRSFRNEYKKAERQFIIDFYPVLQCEDKSEEITNGELSD